MLPFSIVDALIAPGDCIPQVSAERWEEEVVVPVMRSIYSEESVFQYPSSIPDVSVEIELASSYDTSLAVARAHQAIWRSQRDVPFFDFEARWTALSIERREECVGSSLAKAVELTGNITLRTECPDLSLATLCENNGRLFLQILRTIVQSAVQFPKCDNYIAIVSETWDRYYELDRTDTNTGRPHSLAQKRKQLSHQHSRNYFVALFVALCLRRLNFNNTLVEPHRLSDKPRLPTAKASWIRLNSFDEEVGPIWHYRISVPSEEEGQSQSSASPIMKMIGLDSSHREIACRTCARFAAEVEELVEEGKQDLSCCKRCLSMVPPRRVAYCSVDCQRTDWKLHHKQVCGRKLTDIEPSKPVTLGHNERPLTVALQRQLHPRAQDPPAIYSLMIPVKATSVRAKADPRSLIVDEHAMPEDPTSRSLLDQAVASRSLDDIRNFVEYIYTTHTGHELSQRVRDVIILQFAMDWDIDVDMVRDWIHRKIKEQHGEGYIAPSSDESESENDGKLETEEEREESSDSASSSGEEGIFRRRRPLGRSQSF